MSIDRDFRLPYGPGWEDPQWQPFLPGSAAAPATAAARSARATAMAEVASPVQRVERPAARAVVSNRPQPSPPRVDRRWVLAGCAGLVAVGSLMLGRAAAPAFAQALERGVANAGETGAKSRGRHLA